MKRIDRGTQTLSAEGKRISKGEHNSISTMGPASPLTGYDIRRRKYFEIVEQRTRNGLIRRSPFVPHPKQRTIVVNTDGSLDYYNYSDAETLRAKMSHEKKCGHQVPIRFHKELYIKPPPDPLIEHYTKMFMRNKQTETDCRVAFK